MLKCQKSWSLGLAFLDWRRINTPTLPEIDGIKLVWLNFSVFLQVVNDLCALLDDSNTTVSNLLTFSPTEFAEEMETLSVSQTKIIMN